MTIYVTRPSLPPVDEFIKYVHEIFETGLLTNMGPFHGKLTEALRQILDVPSIELFTNGHTALECAIQGLQLTGEVITSPFTFASTTHAIVRSGLTPVFCDIEPETCTIDTRKIEELITEKTSAILPIHVYGIPCNVEKIEDISQRRGLKVIYDAAHAFGVSYKGTGIGNFGDASMFSFHATKVFNTVEGGAVSFHDSQLGESLRRLRNFGMDNSPQVSIVGGNAKMDEFRAAMGLCNVQHFSEEVVRRGLVSEHYDANLAEIPGLTILHSPDYVKTNYAYYPVLIEEEKFGSTRDAVRSGLAKQGIFARDYFHPTTNSFECYEGQFDASCTPVARRVSQMVLTLPLYAGLEIAEVDRISEILRGFYRQ